MTDKTAYFILNSREVFGRGRISGTESEIKRFRELWRYPEWCEVSWLRFVLHPVYHWYVNHIGAQRD